MSLDAYVRCTCIRDGKAKKPHPIPDRLIWDESNAPSLSGDPTEEEWEAHDTWVQEACEHEGLLVSEFLGNITGCNTCASFSADCRVIQDPNSRFF